MSAVDVYTAGLPPRREGKLGTTAYLVSQRRREIGRDTARIAA
jgi:hypothetical protein